MIDNFNKKPLKPSHINTQRYLNFILYLYRSLLIQSGNHLT